MATPKERLFQFENDPMTYQVVYWEELVLMCKQVGAALRDAELEIDVLVGLAKGGWPAARILADVLNIRRAHSIGMEVYSGVGVHAAEPTVYQDIDPAVVKAKTVLLVDDLSDSGTSLQYATNHLLTLGAAQVVTATTMFKPHSSFKPDFYAVETDAWVLFPFENHESATLLTKRWVEQGADEEEIASRLAQLGFDQEV